MKYFEVDFKISPYSMDMSDVLAALIAESAGFESFEYTDYGIKGYVQIVNFNRNLLNETIATFPFPDVDVNYSICEIEDKNWNEEWEKNGFTPVLIADKVCIHSTEHQNIPSHVEWHILINPRQAFGTGTHQTTSMIIEQLLSMNIKDVSVLDAGCGTGILGIFCAMKGASRVFAYDIDRWSVENTLENISLNGISNMEVSEGDASILQNQDTFDLLLANINRNILLADLPVFRRVMHKGSRIILSGFYTEDMNLLKNKAQELGLACIGLVEKENWACLLFEL